MNLTSIFSFLAATAECNIFKDPNANETFVQILGTARLVVRILQILIPVALIIWGTIDLGKAVIAGKDDDIKKGRSTFVKRLVAAVIVFLVPFIVRTVMGLVSDGPWKQCWDDASNQSIINNSTLKGDV